MVYWRDSHYHHTMRWGRKSIPSSLKPRPTFRRAGRSRGAQTPIWLDGQGRVQSGTRRAVRTSSGCPCCTLVPTNRNEPTTHREHSRHSSRLLFVHASLLDEPLRQQGLRWYDTVVYTATRPQTEARGQPQPRSGLNLYNTTPLPPVRGGGVRGGRATACTGERPASLVHGAHPIPLRQCVWLQGARTELIQGCRDRSE